MKPCSETEQTAGEAVGFPGPVGTDPHQGLGLCRWLGCLANAVLGHGGGEARWLLSCFPTGLIDLPFPPDTPVHSDEMGCRHRHLILLVPNMLIVIICCVSALRYRIIQFSGVGRRQSFAPFLYFRGVGFQWEIADPSFIDWVSEGRWLTFPLNGKMPAGWLGLGCETKIWVWIGSQLWKVRAARN